jgi:hypothetical protein
MDVEERRGKELILPVLGPYYLCVSQATEPLSSAVGIMFAEPGSWAPGTISIRADSLQDI